MKENKLFALLLTLLGGITLYDSISNISDYINGYEITYSFRGNYSKGDEALFQHIIWTIFSLMMIVLAYTYIRKKDNKTLDDE